MRNYIAKRQRLSVGCPKFHLRCSLCPLSCDGSLGSHVTQSWPMRYKQMIWVRLWEKFLKGIDLASIFSLSPSSYCGGKKELHFQKASRKRKWTWRPSGTREQLHSLELWLCTFGLLASLQGHWVGRRGGGGEQGEGYVS